jgi:hypothetical protein
VNAALPFARLIHCDWSVAGPKRWRADAVREGDGWRVTAPCRVGDLPAFVDELFLTAGPVLAGFDMPIGLPDEIGRRLGDDGFRALLPKLGRTPPWQDYFRVNGEAETISLTRPFFPDRWVPGIHAGLLTAGLEVAGLDALRRRCERPRFGGRQATPLFWTIGPAQVGKAAISGWRDVLQPALARRARLWPFDGTLDRLARPGAPVLAETYPGEAYGHVGVRFGPRRSKRRATDRQAAAADLPAWCGERKIALSPDLRQAVLDGFAALGAAGEDGFDALIGVLGMIEVVEARRPAAPDDALPTRWEGWILGRPGPTLEL